MIVHSEPHGTSCTEIIQKRGKTTTRFTIKSKNELEIETGSKKRGEVYQIELRSVSETPSRQRFQAGYVDHAVILFGSVAFILLGTAWMAFNTDLHGFGVLLSIFSIPAVITGIVKSRRLRATSYDILVFDSRYGGVAFVIEVNKPDEQTFESFLANLKKSIRAVSPDPIAAGSGDAISGQLAKLYDFYQQGLLTDEEFGAAKQRLLDQENAAERRIGFQVR